MVESFEERLKILDNPLVHWFMLEQVFPRLNDGVLLHSSVPFIVSDYLLYGADSSEKYIPKNT